MQVRLVGVAGVGRDSGRTFTRDQAVGGMVEADQLHGALGGAGRTATGNGTTAVYGSTRPRPPVRRPGSGHGSRRSDAGPRPPPGPPAAPPRAAGRAARPSAGSDPATTRPRRFARTSVTPPGPTSHPATRRRRRGRQGKRPGSRVRSPRTGVPARTRRSLPTPGPRLPDRLAVLGKPLLLPFGEDDRRWRSSSASGYRAVPGAEIEFLPGLGHSPLLEDPPRTAAPLRAFTAFHAVRRG